MFGIAGIPFVPMALGMGFCPESSRWLFQVLLMEATQSQLSYCYTFLTACYVLCPAHAFSHL